MQRQERQTHRFGVASESASWLSPCSPCSVVGQAKLLGGSSWMVQAAHRVRFVMGRITARGATIKHQRCCRCVAVGPGSRQSAGRPIPLEMAVFSDEIVLGYVHSNTRRCHPRCHPLCCTPSARNGFPSRQIKVPTNFSRLHAVGPAWLSLDDSQVRVRGPHSMRGPQTTGSPDRREHGNLAPLQPWEQRPPPSPSQPSRAQQPGTHRGLACLQAVIVARRCFLSNSGFLVRAQRRLLCFPHPKTPKGRPL